MKTVAETITRKGSEINLVFNGYGYRWEGASVPKRLSGLWLDPNSAKLAAQDYLKSVEDRAEKHKRLVAYETTPLEELDVKTRKHELLPFAELHGISIPEDKKNPSSIKAFIKEKLLEMENA